MRDPARVILGIELRQALLVARLGARVVTLVPREDPDASGTTRHRRRRRTPPEHERLFEKDPGCPVVAAEPVQVPDPPSTSPVAHAQPGELGQGGHEVRSASA